MQQAQNLQLKETKSKKFQPHFPTTKIKKIIQQNQQIGKISNLVPPLIEQCLEYFLADLLKKSQQIAQESQAIKLTPQILKKALDQLPSYEFMRDVMEDVQDNIAITMTKSKSSSKGNMKRSKTQNQEDKEDEGKKGRKKTKLQEKEVERLIKKQQRVKQEDFMEQNEFIDNENKDDS